MFCGQRHLLDEVHKLGGLILIRFEGHCPKCGVTHSLPTSEVAVAEARSRVPTVQRALPPDRGRMLGVLIGADHNGEQVVLQAYSGTTMLEGLEVGWAPTTRRTCATRQKEEDTFERLNTLSQTIDSLGWAEACDALTSAQDTYEAGRKQQQDQRTRARSERAKARQLNPDDDVLDRSLRSESWDESVRYRQQLKRLRAPLEIATQHHQKILAQMQVLKSERRTLSNRLQASFDAQQTLTNFQGDSRSVDQAHTQGQALHPGTGECTAPKLLTDAARRGVRPTSMAEIWVGKTLQRPPRIHGELYGPCQERCIPILGHLLCGAERPATVPDDLGLALLAEGRQWVAAHKPGGLLSTPGNGVDKLDCVVKRIRTRHPRGAAAQAVHRLDMETSGVLLIAFHSAGQAALQVQFSKRTIRKTYLAWVQAIPPQAQGTISLPLRQQARGIRRHIVHPQGKPSVTDYLVLGTRNSEALILFRPKTGRSHQLRVHSAHPEGLGAPIIGDRLYGTAGQILHLHAWRLSFMDPDSNQEVDIECPVPPGWPAETLEILNNTRELHSGACV